MKLLLTVLNHTDINKLIKFKSQYNCKMLDLFIYKDILYQIDFYLTQPVLTHICKTPCYIKNINYIYHEYSNHRHVSKFIQVLGNNISKLTAYNVNAIFHMFILTHINRFTGFTTWGTGNCQTIRRNITNHYHKHIIEDGWDSHLQTKNITSYKQFAINNSRYMTYSMVHTNGTKVYLSGLYKNILIIGRLDKNNELGISSCYIVKNENLKSKMKIFNNNKCFDI